MILVHLSGIVNELSKSFPSDLTFIHYASGYQIRFWVLIRLAAALAAISLIVVLIYQNLSALKSLRPHINRKKPSDLTSIGLEASERQHRQWSV